MSRVRPATVPQRLIDDAKSGDQRSFDEIFRTYQPGLMRYLTAVSPSHAADVGAATWESVARTFHRFHGDGDGFRAWLFTIARRRLTDEVRRSTRRPLQVATVPDDPDPRTAADAALDGADWAEAVLRMIPTRQADAVALRVIGGLSVDQTAALLGITAGNVRVLCHRGLQAIAEVLGSENTPATDVTPPEIHSVV
jgi:RNA polymerase sigma-70 factor (ECF subfamily)